MIVVVLAMVLAGISLDRWLNTRPWLTLLFVLGSAPLTMFFLYRSVMRTLAKLPQPPANPGKNLDDHDDE